MLLLELLDRLRGQTPVQVGVQLADDVLDRLLVILKFL